MTMWRWANGVFCVVIIAIGFFFRVELAAYLPNSLASRISPAASVSTASTVDIDGQDTPPIPVRVTVIAKPAKGGSLPILRRTIGTVVPVLSTAISSPVSGTISEIVAKEGSVVKSGDILVRLDNRVISAAIDRDRAILAKDQATLDDANDTLARVDSLTKNGADSKQQGDDAFAAVKEAEATIAVDKANLAADMILSTQMQIRAPFDGRLGLMHFSPGAFIAPGTVIVTLTQMKPVYAEFTLPETDLPLARASYATGTLGIEISPMLLSGFSGLSSGPITLIDNAIDPLSATFKLRALLANDNESLWPGQSLNVLVDVGKIDRLVLVPLVAVQSQYDGTICYVVKPDRTIEIRKVDVALRVGDQAGIIHGLKDGELVVTEGQSSLDDGTPVILEKARSEAATPVETGKQTDQ